MSRIKTLNAKRYVAVFMAMLITVLSLSYTGNKAEALNESRTYYVFDSKTFVQKSNRTYTLEPVAPLENTPVQNTRAIINGEDRKPDTSKSGIVKIITASGSFGTGFIVGDHIIATASHCVDTKLDKILLFNQNGKVSMEATPVETHFPALSRASSRIGINYDYALVTVKEDLSDYIHFSLSVPLDSFNNSEIELKGFPGIVGEGADATTVNTDTTHSMYLGKGNVTSINDYLIHYTADATSGDSGSPVYIIESFNGTTFLSVVAIHRNYDGRNYGVRITTDLIHFYSGNNKNIQW